MLVLAFLIYIIFELVNKFIYKTKKNLDMSRNKRTKN